MAGHKSTVLGAGPLAFWSFDYDTTDSLMSSGMAIIDEMGTSPGTLVGAKYDIQQVSMNELETNEKYSLKLADLDVGQSWEQTENYVVVQHNSSLVFGGLGSFTLEFFYYKKSHNGILRNLGYPAYHRDMTSPIIRKGDAFYVRILDDYNNTDVLIVSACGQTVNVYESTLNTIWNTNNHIVVRWNMRQLDTNTYSGELNVFMNGRLAGSSSVTYTDNYPTPNNTTNLYLGHNGDLNGYYLDDWSTELLQLDQVALYPHALSDTQISNHYRKTKVYENIIEYDKPSWYWKMEDPLIASNSMTANVTSGEMYNYQSYYYGTYERQHPGPDNIIGSNSVYFEKNGLVGHGGAYVQRTSYYGNPERIFNVGANYTLEFWFKSSDNDRGLLFSMTQENYPWRGLNVWLNSGSDTLQSGRIQISEGVDSSLDCTNTSASGDLVNWSDNHWHHLVITRDLNYQKVYIDGKLQGTKTEGFIANGDSSYITLFGASPAGYNISGYMCHLAIYNYTMQEIQINNRFLYSKIYKIEGYTLLEGTPVNAIVRMYSHISGELEWEVESDIETGYYAFYGPNDRSRDIVSFIEDSNNTRYKIHGPVKPAELEDVG
jgi:hypothetical protein